MGMFFSTAAPPAQKSRAEVRERHVGDADVVAGERLVRSRSRRRRSCVSPRLRVVPPLTTSCEPAGAALRPEDQANFAGLLVGDEADGDVQTRLSLASAETEMSSEATKPKAATILFMTSSAYTTQHAFNRPTERRRGGLRRAGTAGSACRSTCGRETGHSGDRRALRLGQPALPAAPARRRPPGRFSFVGGLSAVCLAPATSR